MVLGPCIYMYKYIKPRTDRQAIDDDEEKRGR